MMRPVPLPAEALTPRALTGCYLFREHRTVAELDREAAALRRANRLRPILRGEVCAVGEIMAGRG